MTVWGKWHREIQEDRVGRQSQYTVQQSPDWFCVGSKIRVVMDLVQYSVFVLSLCDKILLKQICLEQSESLLFGPATCSVEVWQYSTYLTQNHTRWKRTRAVYFIFILGHIEWDIYFGISS